MITIEKPFDSVQYPFQLHISCERVAFVGFAIAYKYVALGRLIRRHFGSPWPALLPSMFSSGFSGLVRIRFGWELLQVFLFCSGRGPTLSPGSSAPNLS